MTNGGRAKADAMGAFTRSAALAVAAAVALAGLGYYPTRVLTAGAGTQAMLVGIGVALAGAWAGSLMPILFISPNPRVFLNGILLNLGVRFGGTIALALLLRAMGVGPDKPFLLWVGIGQVVLLATDTVMLLRLVRQLTPMWEGQG